MPHFQFRVFNALLLAPLLLLSFISAAASAQTVEQIVQRANQAQDPLGSVILQSKLTVTPQAGDAREYAMEMRLRREGDQLQSWIGVRTPAALKGMQFVRNRVSATDDRLLLYVPATKQVQEIPAAAREKKFLNSDFALADLQISPTALRQPQIVEELEEHWVVAARPSSTSRYEWLLFTIAKKDFALLRVSFYEVQHKLVKDLIVREFASDSATRLPKRIEMVNHSNGSRSTLEINEFRTQVSDVDLPSHTFTAAFMRQTK